MSPVLHDCDLITWAKTQVYYYYYVSKYQLLI